MEQISVSKFLEVCNQSNNFTEAYRTLGIDYRTFKASAEKLGIFEDLKRKFNVTRGSSSAKGQVFAVRSKYGWKVDPKIWCEEVFKGNIIPSHPYRFKNRLIEAGFKEDKCDRCGISEWNGMPITIQCHHKDGDERNNKLDNIEFLCPNCHS